MDSDDESSSDFLSKNDDFETVNPNSVNFDDCSNSNAEILFSTTSASSAVSSNQNSPRANSAWSNTPVIIREGSIHNDNLTESAEEDLANNNDPNNNAANPEEFEYESRAQSPSSLEFRSEYLIDSISPQPIDDSDPELEEDVRTIRKLLPHRTEDEVKNHLEAYASHPKRVKIVLNNLLEDQIAEERVNKKDKAGNGLKCKNRPKINPVETISFPGETSSLNLEADLQPGPSGATSRVESQLDMARKVKLEKSSEALKFLQTTSTGQTTISTTNPDLGLLSSRETRPATTKRKLPPPSCTVTSEEQEAASIQAKPEFKFNLFGKDESGLAGPSSAITAAATITTAAPQPGSSLSDVNRRRLILDLNLDEHDLVNDSDREPKRARATTSAVTSSGNSTNNSDTGVQKIEITDDHLYGPFNFSAHRPEAAKNAARLKESRDKAASKFRVREDLDDVALLSVRPKMKSRAKATSRHHHNDIGADKMPELVDLGTVSDGDATPPPLVDISKADQQEIQGLVTWLCGMFPTTDRAYIEEQAEDLVGKPAALDRFIGEHLNRDGAVPEDWVPKNRRPPAGVISLDPDLPEPVPMDVDPQEPGDVPAVAGAAALVEPEDHHVEDKVERQLNHLLSVFPNTDPEFLHGKVVEFTDKEREMEQWIDETLEKAASGLPTRKDYEARLKEAELLEKYSGQVTVKEILDMYDNDPESFFMDTSRKVSDLYKRHALGQLKKEFRHTAVNAINKIFAESSGLFLPSYRALKNYHGPKRKTKRADHEAPMPAEIDINFLKELQYARKEDEVRLHLESIESERQKKLEIARANNTLKECDCCSSEECLDEDMLPCMKGHRYCRECIQRASAVAIGEGKTELKCLIHCDQPFGLSTLQIALGANTFSKWLEKIQLAEIEKAGLDGLEQCPFCPFATIMDEPKEDNKVFTCLNPECGKESCRLCKEISHIPLRCDEVEKDVEVRKRTYIENKMAEALIRTCYKCKRPYVKQDGCNKITCSNCGAYMCYICRKPVSGYDHFAGQGMEHLKDKCPLWSDNNSIHDRDVALGALEAKNEMDKEQPQVALKHDPTHGINLDKARADRSKTGNPQVGNNAGPEFPPGLEGFLPQDPFERERMIEEQRRIEQIIQRGGDPGGAAGPAVGGLMAHMIPFFHPAQHHHHHHRELYPNPALPMNNEVLLHRMGELLRLREDQRQRQRAIRRREQLALQEVRLHEIGLPGVGGAAAPPVAGVAPAPPLPGAARPPPPLPNMPRQLMHHHAFVAAHHHALAFPPPPAHRQGPARGVPPPPPAHPGIPRPAHIAPQPPALPLTFGPRQPPELFQNQFRFQPEPLPLRRGGPGFPVPAIRPLDAAQQAHLVNPRRSPDVVQRELERLFEN